MNGSLRQRGPSSWELRAYQGINADTGKRRYPTRTVRGSRAEAQAELALLVDQVDYPRRRAVETTDGGAVFGLQAYFRLAVSSGARRGQICGLRWHDIGLDHGSVAFCRAIAEGPDGLVVVPTKNRRRHRVDIDDQALAALSRHRREVEARATWPPE